MNSGRMLSTVCVMLAGGLLAMSALTALPARADDGSANAKLGQEYIDPGNGFSLRPPAGAQRDRGVATTTLARWVMRDAKTGAIAWQLTVRKEQGSADVDGASLARRLKDGLSKQPDVRVQKAAEAKVAGATGAEVEIIQGTTSQRWQHELWARRPGGGLLVLSVSGTLGLRKQMDGLLTAVAETWKITNPKTQAELRRDSLKRGRELLAGISTAKLAAAVKDQDEWFLYRQGDSDIGFMHVTAKQATEGSTAGVEVHTIARLSLPGGMSMVSKRVLFSTVDRSKERWKESAQVLRGGRAVRQMSESGTCQDNVITCTVTAGGRSNTRKKPLEPAAARSYLPRALAILLPKLVDLSKPAAYGFCSYTTSANEFDLRTFTVGSAARVTLGTQTCQGVDATDQLAADKAPARLELSADGSVLRMTTDAGIVMEQSTRRAVLRRYPDADRK